MLVLYTDGIALWDVKELAMINELRCPRDIEEMLAVDWASSDKIVVLCKDGSIKTMGLALAAVASNALDYHREQPVR